MDIQRAVLLFALIFILLILYQRWLEEQSPPVDLGEIAQQQNAGQGDNQEDIPDAPSEASQATQATDPQNDLQVTAPESGKRIEVETDLVRVEIDTLGGSIKKLELLKHPVSVDESDRPFPLFKEELTARGFDIFTTQSGLIGKDREYPNHKTQYQHDRNHYVLEADSDELTVDLHWNAPDGVRYTKRFSFLRDSYDIKIDFLVDNQSNTPWTGFLYAQYLRTYVPPDQGFLLGALPTYLGGAIYTPEEKFEKIDFDEMHDEALKREVTGGWVAMLQHYFVSAWFPRNSDQPYSFFSRVLGAGDNAKYNIGLNSLAPVRIDPNSSGALGIDLFAGPKEQDRLAKKPEGFDLTVDYGWLTPVSAPLFWVLDTIHDFVGNWGWAIILLTLLIKLIFYPLSAKSYQSMAKMKKLQPRLQTLKDRYGSDKAKLNQAMMEIYKKEKVNPLGGCLPIIIQIPVFIALYWVLLESVELRQAPWLFWIQDLSIKDPFYILPLLMGASMLAQQMLNPAPLDPIQKKIMMAMPIVFTLLFLTFPSGLVLYWLVNNVLSIAQQWYINKNIVG